MMYKDCGVSPSAKYRYLYPKISQITFALGMYDLSNSMKRRCCSGRVSNDSKVISSTRFGSKLKQPENRSKNRLIFRIRSVFQINAKKLFANNNKDVIFTD